jgi:hypothetical protein
MLRTTGFEDAHHNIAPTNEVTGHFTPLTLLQPRSQSGLIGDSLKCLLGRHHHCCVIQQDHKIHS